MDITEPRPKKHCRLPIPVPLPIIKCSNGKIHIFSATFDGYFVRIENGEEMKQLVSMGYFGKANFSRSYPQFAQHEPEIIRQRQFKRRKEWNENVVDKKALKKIIVLPDSDSENENYFVNLKPEYQIDHSRLRENVYLCLEEAFYLSEALGCLKIYYFGKVLSSEQMWNIFSEVNRNFQMTYIAYYYYRSKNWVVKSGLKFGGDFLLYKQGPPFHHASYVVIIELFDKHFKRIEMQQRSMDSVLILGLNRLCEGAGKELLICQIISKSQGQVSYKNLDEFMIKNITVKRWVSSHERQLGVEEI